MARLSELSLWDRRKILHETPMTDRFNGKWSFMSTLVTSRMKYIAKFWKTLLRTTSLGRVGDD